MSFDDAYNDYMVVDDTWTITVNWGDGGSSSYVRQGGGPMPIPGPGMPSPIPFQHTFSHPYLDDEGDDPDPADPTDPTTIDSKRHLVTFTIDDGDGGTDAAVTPVIVNNVAPTVSVAPLIPIFEGDSFDLSGWVSDPGPKDTHIVTLKADLDFDGKFSLNEIFTKSLGAGKLLKTFSFISIGPVIDDGPSPGNGSAFDNMSIVVEVSDDDAGAGGVGVPLRVNNVAPVFSKDFSVDVDYNAGSPVKAIVTGAFTDPGDKDVHTGVVTWGDGQTTSIVVPPFGRTFTATRPLVPGAVASGLNLFPVQVTLQDDDTGEVQKTQTAASACLVKSLNVWSIGASNKLAIAETQQTGIQHAGANVFATYVALGEGNINNCKFERTVIEHTWATVNGVKTDIANTMGNEAPDGPLTTPATPNAGVLNSGIEQQGNQWKYVDQDAPGYIEDVLFWPAGKKATYKFRIKDTNGVVLASSTWTLDLKIDANGNVAVLPAVGVAPLNPPVKIG